LITKKEEIDMTKKGKRNITRREFIKKVGQTAAAVGVSSLVPGFTRRAKAAERDYVLIGYTDPSTGPLAGLGEATPWVNKELQGDEKLQESISKSVARRSG
jgi:hypothetical protein